MTNATNETGWAWFASHDQEHYRVGPCATRNQVIAEALSDELGYFDDSDVHGPACAFHITEARQDPLRLADWIDVEAMMERADDQVGNSDRVSYEHDEPPYFDVTTEQHADLKRRIQLACDEWQAAHGLVFRVNTFSRTRNHEECVIVLPESGTIA